MVMTIGPATGTSQAIDFLTLRSFDGACIGMRILLVEDDADLAQFIRKGLKEERYAVDVASNGEQGFELGIANPYDLIILDIMLPVLDGLSLCRRLRDTGVTAPVLLLTARDTVQDKVSGLDMGGCGMRRAGLGCQRPSRRGPRQLPME